MEHLCLIEHLYFDSPTFAKPQNVVRHTMEDLVTIPELIELVRKQEPERQDIISALTNIAGGNWENKAYFRIVNSDNANKSGAEWQFKENIIIEHEKIGTIIIDYLKDKRIGGIEFYELLD